MRPLALRTVLVATDLTDAVLPGLRTAAELARLTGAAVHVVHAAAGPAAEAERALAEQLRAAGCGPDVLEEVRMPSGPADQAIVREARRIGADAIVLGPHRPNRPPGLGSTAYRVVIAADVPCLVLPVELPLPLDRVLVPIDAAGAARGALAVALTWASALRRRPTPGSPEPTRLVALHVAPAAHEADGEGDTAALEREVALVRDRVAGFAGVEVQQALEFGDDPAASILQRAAADRSDLIVLGTHGHPAGTEHGLGSVSSAVVQRATTPVLLVSPAVWRELAAEPLP
ncbi:MAG TPA: universal stress protein [Longimicrobiales bacterium]|nr:universal stress protein [Longimicrobiales bacterium]